MEEFYLRDYLKIIWQQKIFILAFAIVSVALAITFTMIQPDQFMAEGQVIWQGSPVRGAFYIPKSVGSTLARNEIENAGSYEIEDAETRIKTFRDQSSRLSIDTTSKTIDLDLVGTDSPDFLAKKLTEHVGKVNDELSSEMKVAYESVIEALNRGLQFYREKESELISKLRAAKEGHLQNLMTERERLSNELSSSSDVQSSLTLAKIVELEREIRNVQTEIDSGVFSTAPGWDLQLAEIEMTIIAYELTIREYRVMIDSVWQPLLVTMQPKALPEPVGPEPYFIYIIAGFLGVFLGTLAAFFMHYMRSPMEVHHSARSE